MTLQWLPVKCQIEFKTLTPVFKERIGNAPMYVQNVLPMNVELSDSLASLKQNLKTYLFKCTFLFKSYKKPVIIILVLY